MQATIGPPAKHHFQTSFKWCFADRLVVQPFQNVSKACALLDQQSQIAFAIDIFTTNGRSHDHWVCTIIMSVSS